MTTSGQLGFFDEGSPYLTHPLLTAERSAAEIDEVERLVGSVTGRVLDIGCGFGRHSIELASRGADVTGIDTSPAMIAAARARAAEAKRFADFICIDAADFRKVAQFDLALCLFTTLGQLSAATSDDAPHRELLLRAKQALRPGGQLVIELPDRDRAVDAMVEAEKLGPTSVTRKFDTMTSIITERFAVPSGQVFLLRYRVFDKTEIADLLHDTGFDVRQIVERALVEPPNTMMTIVAARPSLPSRTSLQECQAG